MRMILMFLRVAMARFRGQSLELEVGRRRFHLYPGGEMLPVIAGGAPDEDEEDQVSEDVRRLEAEEEQDEDVSDEEESEVTENAGGSTDDLKLDGEFDKKRAMRTVRQQRAENKKLKAERDEAKAEADERRQAQETEQQKTLRERDEAKAEAGAERTKRERMTVDLAIRDAAVEADVAPKKVKRLLRLVDRDGITVNAEGDVDGVEEAVETILEEFPEFVEAPNPETDDDPDAPKPEPTGGNPDRKRGHGEMTPAKASRLAREDPDRFADMLSEGKIPRSALGGVRYDKLKSEGRLNEEG